MKNKTLLLALCCTLLLQSCATVFGGRITDCQRKRPQRGEPKRVVRPVALVADILIYPAIALPIDFLTCAIYKPCGPGVSAGNTRVYTRPFADSFHIKGTSELYLSEGIVSLGQIRGWVGPPPLQGDVSSPCLHTGALFLTYRYYLSDRFAIGFTAGIDNESGDLSYGNPQFNYSGMDGTTGHYNAHSYTFAPEALFVYRKTPHTLNYGYIGIGGTSFSDKCTLTSNGAPVTLPSNPYDYHPTMLSYQVTPLGFRWGGKVAGFFELGFGYKGLLSGGMSVRL